jgi:hypothetical protein
MDIKALEDVLVRGDISKLSVEQRLSYLNRLCEVTGLEPLTRPFEFIKLNGREVLYAKRDATDQLRKIHGVSITISSREKIGDVYVVTARAKDRSGREDESTGAVALGPSKGDVLANLYMKAETKAKRRVTLSICGLGLLDESEVQDVPQTHIQTQVSQFITEKPAAIEAEHKEVSSLPDGVMWDGEHAYKLKLPKEKWGEVTIPWTQSALYGFALKDIPEEKLIGLLDWAEGQFKKNKMRPELAEITTYIQEFCIDKGYMEASHRVLPI